jgi:hypothetical protein
MKRSSTRVAQLVGLVLPVLGCGPYTYFVQLEPYAQHVQIVHGVSSRCRYLGEVYGSSMVFSTAYAMAGARNDLRNHAAALGANFVVLDNTLGQGALTGQDLSKVKVTSVGRAFLCRTEPEPAESPGAKAPSSGPAAAAD